jgi:glycosidase
MPNSVSDEQVKAALREARVPSRVSVEIDGRAVPVPTPFPSPEDWRDHWIYFLMVDRFSNPADLPRPASVPWDQTFGGFRGGTLEGVRQRLGYLQRLGAGALWLTPVLQNCQAQDGTFHGYGIQNFLKVDPRFASDRTDPEAELRRLVDEAHARGLYVILDIVLHHAGDVFAYLLDGGALDSAAPWRDGGYPIRWRDAQNRPVPEWADAPPDGDPRLTADAAVWPRELRRNDLFRRQGRGGEAGGDFESLKGFRTSDPELRRTLILAYQYAIARFDIDGFRIDTLKYIEPDFARVFGNAMREYALEIGKKNFFTFGEVYDDDYKIAKFIGRNAQDPGDLVGVDAALDFPLFFRLPGFAKGFVAPSEIAQLYQLRKQVEEGVISSHGEASGYFVTFLDNHDQRNRFRYCDPAEPGRYDDQVTLGLACLYSLQGIPCLYYGTEQGLCGAGDSDGAVREALWGKPNGFDTASPFFAALKALAQVRAEQPALRYGRQYFRPISGDRRSYGISTFRPGVLAVSRILNDEEVVLVANADQRAGAQVSVIVDASLNAAGTRLRVLYSNRPAPAAPDPVEEIGGVTVREVDGGASSGPVRAVGVTLGPGEAPILGR